MDMLPCWVLGTRWQSPPLSLTHRVRWRLKGPRDGVAQDSRPASDSRDGSEETTWRVAWHATVTVRRLCSS